jgi:cysteine sulfinate desulfinase/cysteine desulfurase-like protein
MACGDFIFAAKIAGAGTIKHEVVHGSIVMTLGRHNSHDQITAVASAAKNTVEVLRALSLH